MSAPSNPKPLVDVDTRDKLKRAQRDVEDVCVKIMVATKPCECKDKSQPCEDKGESRAEDRQ